MPTALNKKGLSRNTQPLVASRRLRPNVIEYPYHYCPMATDMIQWLCQLPYGNERELNDGRRTSRTPQRAWMEPVQAETQRQRILLCTEMENGRDLHHITNQVARTDKGKGSGEDRGCVRVANIFSVTAQSTPIDWNPLSADCCSLLLRAHSTTLPYDTSREWYGVAGGGL